MRTRLTITGKTLTGTQELKTHRCKDQNKTFPSYPMKVKCVPHLAPSIHNEKRPGQGLTRGWTVRGSNPGGGKRFPPHQSRPAMGPTGSPLQSVAGLFPGDEALTTPPPHLAPWSRISRALPLPSLCASHGILRGGLYLYT